MPTGSNSEVEILNILKNFCRTRKEIDGSLLTCKVLYGSQMVTGIFHQTHGTVGDTACKCERGINTISLMTSVNNEELVELT